MEVGTSVKSYLKKVGSFAAKLKGSIVQENSFSQKRDLNFKTIRVFAAIGVLIFITVVFLLPTEVPIEFTEKIEPSTNNSTTENPENSAEKREVSAQSLWAAPKISVPGGGGSTSQVNHNTSMIIGSKGGNAKTELRAGIRLPLRILDKVIVSQDAVPILAELILDSQSDSGLKLPAGTRFYGEASFQRGGDRAQIRFSQISLPNGQLRRISAMALDKSGQPGVPGKVFSDGMKNTAGQVLTTFVGGLAAGSMQTDMMGNSKGGLENGVLGAVAATAQSRAQAYGEKLKTEREWIELSPGSECDAVLSGSLKLQEGGDEYE
ncbi:MAG: TrbI/VirB10 family protein [Bdellovibrionaceae bacterium]|nr:TrbI/VirB10 family protein [Pseudobdellovibrionaceae bacterium]